jgi:hypothetical protein
MISNLLFNLKVTVLVASVTRIAPWRRDESPLRHSSLCRLTAIADEEKNRSDEQKSHDGNHINVQ